MNTYAGRGRTFFLVALLLLISILLEQYLIVGLLPWVSGLGGIRPMVVFLDIPVGFPLTIDCIPVGILFSFFYSIVLIPGLPRVGGSVWPALRKRVGGVLMGLLVLLVCLMAGGGIFYLLQDHLPREVRNGIDSFGIQADLYLPYPGEGRIHLRGGMILLLAVYFGVRVWMPKKKELPVAVVPDRETIRTAGKKIVMQVPEPVLVERPAGRREPVLVERPEGPMTGRMYPCIVDRGLLPKKPGEPAYSNSPG